MFGNYYLSLFNSQSSFLERRHFGTEEVPSLVIVYAAVLQVTADTVHALFVLFIGVIWTAGSKSNDPSSKRYCSSAMHCSHLDNGLLRNREIHAPYSKVTVEGSQSYYKKCIYHGNVTAKEGRKC
jgi:hypothetical protein